jgi:hypothetical protein
LIADSQLTQDEFEEQHYANMAGSDQFEALDCEDGDNEDVDDREDVEEEDGAISPLVAAALGQRVKRVGRNLRLHGRLKPKEFRITWGWFTFAPVWICLSFMLLTLLDDEHGFVLFYLVTTLLLKWFIKLPCRGRPLRLV